MWVSGVWALRFTYVVLLGPSWTQDCVRIGDLRPRKSGFRIGNLDLLNLEFWEKKPGKLKRECNASRVDLSDTFVWSFGSLINVDSPNLELGQWNEPLNFPCRCTSQRVQKKQRPIFMGRLQFCQLIQSSLQMYSIFTDLHKKGRLGIVKRFRHFQSQFLLLMLLPSKNQSSVLFYIQPLQGKIWLFVNHAFLCMEIGSCVSSPNVKQKKAEVNIIPQNMINNNFHTNERI